MSKREILFRGKRVHGGEWVEGIPSYDVNGNLGEMESYKGFCECAFAEIDVDTVCQYTGLIDKNGRKIFEGDICEIHSSYIDKEDGYSTVEWDIYDAKFVLEGERFSVDFEMYRGYEIEVLGNIYDNPELLGEGGRTE